MNSDNSQPIKIALFSIFFLAVIIFVAMVVIPWAKGIDNKLGVGVAINNFDTTSAGFTASTSTINTTSTQVFSLITRVAYLINDTTAKITCSLDAANTTAASSTVSSGRGVIVYSSSSVAFGECRGQQNCYPHKGAVNCLGNVTSSVSKLVQ